MRRDPFNPITTCIVSLFDCFKLHCEERLVRRVHVGENESTSANEISEPFGCIGDQEDRVICVFEMCSHHLPCTLDIVFLGPWELHCHCGYESHATTFSLFSAKFPYHLSNTLLVLLWVALRTILSHFANS